MQLIYILVLATSLISPVMAGNTQGKAKPYAWENWPKSLLDKLTNDVRCHEAAIGSNQVTIAECVNMNGCGFQEEVEKGIGKDYRWESKGPCFDLRAKLFQSHDELLQGLNGVKGQCYQECSQPTTKLVKKKGQQFVYEKDSIWDLKDIYTTYPPDMYRARMGSRNRHIPGPERNV
ncbi:hypothetical protein AMATHDRAFT_88373 [Amanita thiersii Skay4041]|uniref:Secreted protein n=1 Tax=Amanita thiersii Skay4041 TaxID=703135 RepID=A0A2A9NFD6_9AGAR|nr:hypothetical protein AMATHDRAFT_88373 [Amanita thiersii Skay4041]